MRLKHLITVPFVSVLLASCGGELPPGSEPRSTPTSTENTPPRLGLFALRASNGNYISCTMTPDSAGHVGLYASRPTIGPNEVFTAWYSDDGRLGIKAPNGKFVTADRNNGGKLVADRDYVGEWESFELVQASPGLISLRNTNGRFVCPHYELPGARANQLSADKGEAFDWERFTVVEDPAIGQ